MFARGSTWAVVIALTLVALALFTARPSQGAGHEQRHVVQPGETLWGIASEACRGDLRKAVWRIERRNGLSGSPLEPGTVIYLPS